MVAPLHNFMTVQGKLQQSFFNQSEDKSSLQNSVVERKNTFTCTGFLAECCTNTHTDVNKLELVCNTYHASKKKSSTTYLFEKQVTSEWPNLHFYIWPNTEAEAQCWFLLKFLSICRFNPFLIKQCRIFNGQHNHFF